MGVAGEKEKEGRGEGGREGGRRVLLTERDGLNWRRITLAKFRSSARHVILTIVTSWSPWQPKNSNTPTLPPTFDLTFIQPGLRSWKNLMWGFCMSR